MQTYFRSLLVAALVAGLALVGCGKDDKGDRAQPTSSSSSAQGSVPLSGEAPVRIINFEFKPQTIVVKPGTKVIWTNEDTSIHDIKDTSPLGIPQSKDLSKGDTFSATYSQPGTYTYICGIHQYMTGSVQVVS